MSLRNIVSASISLETRINNPTARVNTKPALEPAALSKLVCAAFNTWAFKRQQPTEPKLLLRFVERAVQRQLPIEFVLYWGKGPRHALAHPERECLQFLQQMTARIANVYVPGAKIVLIGTDTHAILNGHSPNSLDTYFAQLSRAAAEHGFSFRHLSEIVNKHDDRTSKQSLNPEPRLFEKLKPCADKWYRGDGESTEGALKYHAMNMVEREAVELEFPESIFVTFNNSEFRELFPMNLPVFYMYSLRKGCSVKPWFITNEDAFKAPLEASSSSVASQLL